MKCPLRNWQHETPRDCLGEDCALAADGAGQCLIQQALSLYVSGERARLAEESERTRREVELSRQICQRIRDFKGN